MSLLPANATDTEKALEAASARLAEVPIPVATVGDAAEAPANVLPFLAWAKSVDESRGRPDRLKTPSLLRVMR